MKTRKTTFIFKFLDILFIIKIIIIIIIIIIIKSLT